MLEDLALHLINWDVHSKRKFLYLLAQFSRQKLATLLYIVYSQWKPQLVWTVHRMRGACFQDRLTFLFLNISCIFSLEEKLSPSHTRITHLTCWARLTSGDF
jgi:hypothetical protein